MSDMSNKSANLISDRFSDNTNFAFLALTVYYIYNSMLVLSTAILSSPNSLLSAA